MQHAWSGMVLAGTLTGFLLSPEVWGKEVPVAEDGVIRITEAGVYDTALGAADSLVVSAGGEVTLTVASSAFEGAIDVENGSTLKLTVLSAAGRPSGVNVRKGSTLHLDIPAPGQTTVGLGCPVVIAGTGVDQKGAFRYTQNGTAGYADNLLKELELSDDATIECASRWGLGNAGGKSGRIVFNEHTLTRVGTASFMLTAVTLTPGTLVNGEGKIIFVQNGGDFGMTGSADETVIRMNGGKLSFWNTSKAVPYKVVFAGGVISADNGSGLPPKNCLGGPVEVVGSDMKIELPSGTSCGLIGSLKLDKKLEANGVQTVYLGGPISGLGHIRSVNGAQVSFVGENTSLPRAFYMVNGSMEYDGGHANVSFFRCANGSSATGVFRQKGGSLCFATDTPFVGESAGSFGAYVFEGGLMAPSNNYFGVASEKAGSHGIFVQKGGIFELRRSSTSYQPYIKQGACNAEAVYVQTGGTNDTFLGASGGTTGKRFAFGECGGTNLSFAISGAGTLFRTAGFTYACSTNVTKGVIAINDGAKFKARRFNMGADPKAGSEICMSLNGGELYPLFVTGWGGVDDGNSASFKKRAPHHVTVYEKGVTIDTSECVNSLGQPGVEKGSTMPLTLCAPEGRGIASVELPDLGDEPYRGPAPVVIVGPAGSYGASAYADYDFGEKRLVRIVVTSPGCNYDDTAKVYVLSADGKTRHACPTYALTDVQRGGGLVKRGASPLYLYGDNTYSGGTTVEEGTLSLKNSAFPDDTPVAVAKGAKLDLNGKAVRVSRLAGAGTVVATAGLTVGSLALDADEIFAEGATALNVTGGAATFASGATVDVSLSPERAAGYAERGALTVLTADGGVVGNPSLTVNGRPTVEWRLRRRNGALQFEPVKGLLMLVR